MGSHEIRRVKTTTKVEPGAGAVMQPSINEVAVLHEGPVGVGGSHPGLLSEHF